jgi:hypothetical protein
MNPLNSFLGIKNVARNVSRHGRNENAKLATPPHNFPGSVIENNMVSLQFSTDQEF